MIAIESQGRGAPLVLLHGVGTSRVVWHRVLPALSARRQVAALDLPGFGESTPAGDGFDLDRVADAVADAAARAVEPPFDLLGHSLGGAVAFVMALRHPDAVSRLVLVAPAGFANRPPLPAGPVGAAAAWAIRGRRLLGAPLAWSPAARRVLLWGTVADPAALPTSDARSMLEASRGALRLGPAIATALRAHLRPRLPALEVPLGLIWGERDGIVPIRGLAVLAEYAAPGAVQTIPLAGHVPQLERPPAFAAAVERALARLHPVTVS